jgi:DUF3102 family protein
MPTCQEIRGNSLPIPGLAAAPSRCTVGTRRHAMIGGPVPSVQKEEISHEEWLPWLEKSFGWSQPTAYRYMRVAEAFGELSTVHNLPQLSIEASIFYALSAPSMPQSVRNVAVKEARPASASLGRR